jgi:transposase
MESRREFWIRHVAGWRRSGMSLRAYAARNGLARGTLGFWSSKLNSEAKAGGGLVEVGRGGPKATPVVERPVEVLVGGRHVLRVWSGTPEGHLSMVLTVLARQA